MYKTDYTNTGNKEFKNMGEGEHTASITKTFFRDRVTPDGLAFEDISILWANDKDETAFDTIFQNVDDTGEYLEYTKWKMNAYSLALGIPENTNFASIHEWLEYILGRTAKVTVTQKGNYLNITKVEPAEQFTEEDLGF